MWRRTQSASHSPAPRLIRSCGLRCIGWIAHNASIVPEDLKYLGLSYQLGPNEGWVALKRNRAAFAAFQQLPPDLAEHALSEFVSLLESKFYEQAADIFTGPAWPVRDVIVPRLKDVAEDRRRFFAQILSSRDYDVELPGIKFPEKLPWQRER